MARQNRRGRDVSGILLLDKPVGYTSNQILQRVKRLLNAKKAGHTGSLDPIATGLLPLCFGEATKVSRFLLDSDKRYLSTFQLGQATNTCDTEGEVISERPVKVNREQIEQALTGFMGDIQQIPPMHSAIKRNGQPLYKLARQGIELELEPRQVTVHDLKLINLSQDACSLELDITCSKGFYIRSLARDLGETLGCGAHVSALRRLVVAGFQVDDAISLHELEGAEDATQLDQYLLHADDGLGHLPGVQLSQDAAYYLCRGQAVRAADSPATGWVRLYANGARFLGVGQVLDDGRIAPKRLFHSG
ncbi:MAG: tRNA pseudouridine(55) synthase TruB [Gammaproteobacteria bacterium]|nr:tRNA pseudouridine(55) synthase TruB [Gammaproteobacteria bacterium]